MPRDSGFPAPCRSGRAWALFLLLLGAPAAAWGGDRSRDLARVFHDFCLTARPDWPVLSAKARTLNAKPLTERTIALAGGKSVQEKAWQADGFELTAFKGDITADASHALGCGLSAAGADGAALAQALAADAGLGTPAKRAADGADQGNVVSWTVRVGGSQGQVLLSYGVPGLPGATVNLILPGRSPSAKRRPGHKAAVSP